MRIDVYTVGEATPSGKPLERFRAHLARYWYRAVVSFALKDEAMQVVCVNSPEGRSHSGSDCHTPLAFTFTLTLQAIPAAHIANVGVPEILQVYAYL
jgi:hypothetical protein